jgi:drug/metabolite transporter (DMT)-like permease
MWLAASLIAYFFLAIVSLFDRYLLVGPMPSPKAYTFNVGIFGLVFCLILFFFAGIDFPSVNIIMLGLLIGVIRIIAILFLTISITKSEVSRVVPAIGALQPIFSFLLFFLFLPQSLAFSVFQAIAFILLVFGSALISVKKFNKEFFNFRTLKYPIAASFLYSLTFFLTKYLFIKENDFLIGIFLILFGSGLASLAFIVFPNSREIILKQKISGKISGLFLLGQAIGGIAIILQNYSVFLAGVEQVPLINALEGTRYVFLLFFVFLLAGWKPQILKEEVTKEAFLPKVIAVLLIAGGMFFLIL